MKHNKKITRNEVIPILLAKCPDVLKSWEEHVNFYGEEARVGGYLDIGVIAHHLVEQFKIGKTDFLLTFFDTVEEILINCDEGAEELVTIGFIEDLQNISSHYFGYDKFEKYLGAKTKENWNYIIKIWEGKTSLMDVLRSENKKNENRQ